MKIKAVFLFNGQEYVYEREASNLDRNYNDEPYALILEPIPNTENGLFEINILKDAEVDGKLREDGYVAIYENADNTMCEITLNCQIIFEFEEWEKWASTHTIADYEKC